MREDFQRECRLRLKDSCICCDKLAARLVFAKDLRDPSSKNLWVGPVTVSFSPVRPCRFGGRRKMSEVVKRGYLSVRRRNLLASVSPQLESLQPCWSCASVGGSVLYILLLHVVSHVSCVFLAL